MTSPRRSRRKWSIAQLSAVAETIGRHNPGVRLPERDLPAQLLPLVRSFNGALQRLEQSAEAQREFLRRAAHQLRTPMTVLSARVQLLDDAETAAELRQDVGELTRILSQLVQLNEIDGMPDNAAAIADLDAVGVAIRGALGTRADRQGATIWLLRPGAPVLVRGDPNVIEVAIRNLVENAIEYAPAGSTIELRIEAGGRIAVADAGPGIAEDIRDKIFEPFWSGDGDGAHAGLGLTIVRRIAERYGATLSVVSPAGGGASFTIDFVPSPLEAADLDTAAARASVPASLLQRRRREALDRAAG